MSDRDQGNKVVWQKPYGSMSLDDGRVQHVLSQSFDQYCEQLELDGMRDHERRVRLSRLKLAVFVVSVVGGVAAAWVMVRGV
jgi:hypothetical protein